MQATAEFTLPEKILLAAVELDEAGQTPFSAEALIVRVWQAHPRTFGLKGFEEQFPDSNKVLWGIMGEKGLPKRGYLSKVGQKLYSLTTEGRELARHLREGTTPPPPPRPVKPVEPVISRPQDLLLQAMLATPVWTKWRQGRSDDWTFTEAMRFWNMGERQGKAVDDHITDLRQQLSALETALQDAPAQLGNGRTVTREEIAALAEVHETLMNRFARHLSLLRSRPDR
jgi:hypothetical protein